MGRSGFVNVSILVHETSRIKACTCRTNHQFNKMRRYKQRWKVYSKSQCFYEISKLRVDWWSETLVRFMSRSCHYRAWHFKCGRERGIWQVVYRTFIEKRRGYFYWFVDSSNDSNWRLMTWLLVPGICILFKIENLVHLQFYHQHTGLRSYSDISSINVNYKNYICPMMTSYFTVFWQPLIGFWGILRMLHTSSSLVMNK